MKLKPLASGKPVRMQQQSSCIATLDNHIIAIPDHESREVLAPSSLG
jgi:hypothetical protein